MITFQQINNGNTDSAFFARNGGWFISNKVFDNQYMVIEFLGNLGNQEIGFHASLYLSDPVDPKEAPDDPMELLNYIWGGGSLYLHHGFKRNHARQLLKNMKDFANKYADQVLNGIV